MIPTFKASIVRKDMDAVLTCMVEETFSHGEASRIFLKKIAGDLDVPAVYGLREYPRAMELLFRAWEIGKGKRVALSVLSPPWYYRLIRSLDLEAVFLDVDPDYCTIRIPEGKEPAEIADIFLIHHHLGYESDLSWLEDSPVPVIEDLSQTLAGRISGESLEKRNTAGIFYLGERDYLNALGSAYIFFSDRKNNQEIKRLVEELDESQLLSDPQAAMGASQWQRKDKFFARRCELRDIFMASLQKSRNRSFALRDDARMVPYTFPVLLRSGAKDAIAYARKKKILCSLAFEDSILTQYPDAVTGDFPGAKGLALRCILFPLYPAMSREDIEIITKVLSTLP